MDAQNKTQEQQQQVLRSIHTSNLVDLFHQNHFSLAITTYQAGKVILIRADGNQLNTHFRSFSRPMGLAVNSTRMVIGDTCQIFELYNMPQVAPKLEPIGRHDACYIPRNIHFTGDIDIHEMAWADDDKLWFVNTRFSCLCTVDNTHSFVPRWRPSFISGLGAEDRCHLNGMAINSGQPAYVTALGDTNTAQGWREQKARGGVLMHVHTNEIICRGLSMPHSPRLYDGRLWVLESGQGSLATVNPNTGELETVLQLPGFTRGLDFWGPFAFVGLSKVRESAVFGGLPLTERLDERICGVWVVNIKTGNLVGFLQFKAAVQEIFAVAVIPHAGFPDILEPGSKFGAMSYALPDDAIAQVETT